MWCGVGLCFVLIVVNVMFGDFCLCCFVDMILVVIVSDVIVFGDVCVEINEDVLVGCGGGCVCVEIDRLYVVGVLIVFDDFGIGFVLLCYLCDLLVDVVKIDKSFIYVIVDDCVDCVIVGNVIEFVYSLGKLVMVEGVELLE